MEKNSGGFVYPQFFEQPKMTQGITRRDWLAGMAIDGLANNSIFVKSLSDQKGAVDINEFCKTCYKLADAMIEEGEK